MKPQSGPDHLSQGGGYGEILDIQIIRGGTGRVENYVKLGGLFLVKEDAEAIARRLKLTRVRLRTGR